MLYHVASSWLGYLVYCVGVSDCVLVAIKQHLVTVECTVKFDKHSI